MEHPFLMFLDHTQRRTTVGRTPLDERSARRRDLCLTTHNTHNRQTSMPPGGIRIHDLSRRAAADLRLRPRGHWDRPNITSRNAKCGEDEMNHLALKAAKGNGLLILNVTEMDNGKETFFFPLTLAFWRSITRTFLKPCQLSKITPVTYIATVSNQCH